MPGRPDAVHCSLQGRQPQSRLGPAAAPAWHCLTAVRLGMWSCQRCSLPSQCAASATQLVLQAFTRHLRPGRWLQAIFRMNQKQLEVAMRRMWSDSSLEADRKAYLMQHVMASRSAPLACPWVTLADLSTWVLQLREPQRSCLPALAAALQQSTVRAGGRARTQLASLCRYIVAQQQKRGLNPVPALLPHGTAARTYHDPAETILGCTHYRRRWAWAHSCIEHSGGAAACAQLLQRAPG